MILSSTLTVPFISHSKAYFVYLYSLILKFLQMNFLAIHLKKTTLWYLIVGLIIQFIFPDHILC